jgi:hypothetical protein
MGDVIDFLEYKRKKEVAKNDYKAFMDELRRLNTWSFYWTPYDIALEKQNNVNWMDIFFYPDEDW